MKKEETDFSEKITNDTTAQVGAGLTTVGAFGKAAAITKGIGVTAGLKGGVLVGSFLTPPVAIIGGLSLIGISIIKCLFKD